MTCFINIQSLHCPLLRLPLPLHLQEDTSERNKSEVTSRSPPPYIPDRQSHVWVTFGMVCLWRGLSTKRLCYMLKRNNHELICQLWFCFCASWRTVCVTGNWSSSLFKVKKIKTVYIESDRQGLLTDGGSLLKLAMPSVLALYNLLMHYWN